jgi:serine/threonine protein kinase
VTVVLLAVVAYCVIRKRRRNAEVVDLPLVEAAPVESFELQSPPPAALDRISELILNRDDREQVPGSTPRRSGRVTQCRDRTTGKICAVKQFRADDLDGDKFLREAEFLSRFRHPGLLGIIGIVMPQDGQPAQIVTEWMERGSLGNLMRRKGISNTQKVIIIVGVSKCMRYLHAGGCIHCDLKPENVLIDNNMEIRVADFGLAKIFTGVQTMTQTKGTLLFMAPETDEIHYTNKVDVFSFAMIVWELVTGKTLVELMTELHIRDIAWHRRVVNGERPRVDGLDGQVVELLHNCWSAEESRWSFEEIVDYLASLDYQLLPDVDVSAVHDYVRRIDEFEATHPPPSPGDSDGD